MSPDWESTIYDTPGPIQTRSFHCDHPPVSNHHARSSRIRINDSPTIDLNDIERGDHSSVMMPTLHCALPVTPEITPSPTKRWPTPPADDVSPTKSKGSSTPQSFRFGLPTANDSTQNLGEYPFHAEAYEEQPTSTARLFKDYMLPTAHSGKRYDYLGTANSNPRPLAARLPAPRTLRKYTTILIGCVFFLATLRLFLGPFRSGHSLRHQTRYVNTPITRDSLLADHHDPENYERFAHMAGEAAREEAALARRRIKGGHAGKQRLSSDYKTSAEIEQRRIEAEMQKGSDWAWKPAVKDRDGLYLLDELEEDENDLQFERSRTEEEYQEIERQISKSNAFSSLSLVHHPRHSSGRPESRLDGLDNAQVLALRQLEERNRIASLRALVAFISEGAEFPESWSEGENAISAAIKAAWTDVDGNGLEGALKKLLGRRAAVEVYPRGWKADFDDQTKLVVFSQSYCPYSRHLKRILDNYNISPSPYYIEVNQRDDGPIIQSLLQEFTARSTIPTVLLNSQPIGGSDELELAAAEGSLARIFAREGLHVTKKYS